MTKNIGTMSEWQRALDDLAIERQEKVPNGWINARDYSQAPATRCEISTAQHHLKKLREAGKAECRKFNNVRHYRLIEK